MTTSSWACCGFCGIVLRISGFDRVEENGNGKSKGEGNCAVVAVEEGVKM
jgi:hypothetical protein